MQICGTSESCPPCPIRKLNGGQECEGGVFSEDLGRVVESFDHTQLPPETEVRVRVEAVHYDGEVSTQTVEVVQEALRLRQNPECYMAIPNN